MFALPCSQPSDRPAPHPAAASALPPRRNPVTGVVSVFPLRSSPSGMWFQVHARLSIPSPIEIVAFYHDKSGPIRGTIVSDCGLWLSLSQAMQYKRKHYHYPVGSLVSASDIPLAGWNCVARASRGPRLSDGLYEAHAGRKRVSKSKSVSSRETRTIRLVVSLTRFRNRRRKRMH